MRIDKKKIHQPEKKSPQTHKSLKGKSPRLPQTTKIRVKDFTHTENLGKLLKSLRRALDNMQPLEKSPLFKALPPLKQILTFLDNRQLNPGDRDLSLLEKFITSWLDKYGGSLPGSRKKELIELVNLLRNSNSETPPYFISGPMGDVRERWKLSFKDRDHDRARDDDDNTVSCSIQVTTESLGKVFVQISQEKKGRQCLLLSSDEKVRSLLTDNMDRFREQLEKHGWEMPLLNVSPLSHSTADPEEKDYKGVDLWG